MGTKEEVILGIDLGTTYSCSAYVHEGKPKIVPSEKGYTTVPSVVGLSKKNEIVVGHPAMDQMVTRPEDTIYGSKRLVGRNYNSTIVQKMLETMVYRIVPGANGEAAVMIGDKMYSLTRISAFILGEIRDMAQGQLQKEINKAVVTVPAYYSDNQRQAVKEAGALAGLKVERIVSEPTAAAIAYGFNKDLDQKILVFDLGGGTFDISVLHLKGNDFNVLATGGDTFLGGVDFDTRIAEYVLDGFSRASGKDIREEKIAVQRVRAASERAKRDLSLEKEAKIQLPFITEIQGEPTDLHIKLNRNQLNKLTLDLVERTVKMCDEVLTSINLKHSDIHEILLVGGQTRMPLVQDKIREHFGREPRKGVHPDEVVAIGAAILANSLESEKAVTLQDVLSIPIGVALPNGRFKTILDRNTPIPASRPFKLSLKRGQSIEIDIYQGKNPTILDNEYLGTFTFPPARGDDPTQMLEMRFDLSQECLLTVQARDLSTGERTSAGMITNQTPKSLRDAMEKAMKDDKRSKSGWFSDFANRVLGK